MASSFTQPLKTQYVGGGYRRLVEGFEFRIGSPTSSNIRKYPKGFITDYASVPWAARWLIPKDGDTNQAATGHDFEYFMNKLLKFLKYNIHPGDYIVLERDRLYLKDFKPLSRKECDDLFLEMMEVLDSDKDYDIPLWKRRTMYRAVRVGGFWWPLKKKKVLAKIVKTHIKALGDY